MEYLKLWKDRLALLAECTLEEKGMILDACIAYQDGEAPCLPEGPEGRYVRLIWGEFQKMLDANAKKQETNAQNGRQGGRPTGRQASASPETQGTNPQGEGYTERAQEQTRRVCDAEIARNMEKWPGPAHAEDGRTTGEVARASGEAVAGRADSRTTEEKPNVTQMKPTESKNQESRNRNQEPGTRNQETEMGLPTPKPPFQGAGFDAFWAAYPRKQGKAAAEKAWKKLSPDEKQRDVIMTALRQQRASPQWQKDGGQFIPHAAKWLNERRWEDQMPTGYAGRTVSAQQYGQRDYAEGELDAVGMEWLEEMRAAGMAARAGEVSACP